MNPDLWARAKEEFERIHALIEADQIAAIEALRTSSPELAELVEKLLEHQDVSDDTGNEVHAHSSPIIDGYEIHEEIGRGGMGVVYRAWQTHPRRLVALKLLSMHALLSRRDIDRFRREANAASKIDHPHVVRVYAAGIDNKHHYIAMEYVESKNLAEVLGVLKGAPAGNVIEMTELPRFGSLGYIRSVTNVVAQIASAIQAAHTMGIVHRDIKPSNILLNASTAKLADFGISRDETQGRITVSREIPGTPDYMSPEQVRAQHAAVDHRTDIYSLGAVLFELLTLRRPYEGASSHTLAGLIAGPSTPPPVRKLNPRVPRDLAIITEKAMEKDVEDRYASASELYEDLQRFLANEAIVARGSSIIRKLSRTFIRRRMAFMIITLLLAVTVITLIGVIKLRRAARADTVHLRLVRDGTELDAMIVTMDRAGMPVDSARTINMRSPVILKQGQYRIVAINKIDQSTAEINITVTETGPEHDQSIYILDQEEPWPSLNSNEMCAYMVHNDKIIGDMITVPAGLYSTRIINNNDKSVSKISIGTFYIDRCEVTNGEYRQFTQATGHVEPYHWRFTDEFSSLVDLPVVWVTRQDAEAYARWRGKRLPTFAEWQAAARGTHGAMYPGGESSQPNIESVQPYTGREASRHYLAYFEGVVPVDQPALWDPSDGLLHTYSNVRELTSTVNIDNLTVYVAGRCWTDDPSLTLSNLITTGLRNPGGPRTGFRCAKSIMPVTGSNTEKLNGKEPENNE